MIDVEDIVENTLARFFSWSGYPIFKELFLDDKCSSIYLSGGVIRNSIMKVDGKEKDFDFFINTDILDDKIKVLERYGTIHCTPYGAPRWFPDNCNEYADIMPIRFFSPGLWHCIDIIDVLNQFDFTMNAVALDLKKYELINPVNGIRDASYNILKMVRFDYPAGQFINGGGIDRNAILWIRGIHYASKYNLTIEPLTLSWMKRHSHFSSNIPLFTKKFFKPEQSFLQKGEL